MFLRLDYLNNEMLFREQCGLVGSGFFLQCCYPYYPHESSKKATLANIVIQRIYIILSFQVSVSNTF